MQGNTRKKLMFIRLCRKTCSCSWTSNCTNQTLVLLTLSWLAAFCVWTLADPCWGWAVLGTGSISCWWLPGQQPGLMVCLVSKEVQIFDQFKSDWKVLVSSQEGWSYNSVFCAWGLRGIWVTSKALRSPGLEWNTITLWSFFLLNIGIIRKHGELKLSHNVKPVIIVLEGATKKSLTALHEEYPVKI